VNVAARQVDGDAHVRIEGGCAVIVDGARPIVRVGGGDGSHEGGGGEEEGYEFGGHFWD
jgi:hypothetical protein